VSDVSGLGFGYCQRILRQLSSDASLPPPDARHLPQTSTSTSSLVPSNDSSLARYISSPNTKPPTLTLILACRSRQKAELAIKKLRREHELGLMGRRMRGGKDREGWEQGLEIVFEELDVDRVGGRGGVLDFSRRIKEK
jgi:3-keto steroid reductase